MLTVFFMGLLKVLVVTTVTYTQGPGDRYIILLYSIRGMACESSAEG